MVCPGLNAGFTPLMAACKADSVEAVKTLLSAGADPSTADSDGVTALMVAAAHSQVHMPEASSAPDDLPHVLQVRHGCS